MCVCMCTRGHERAEMVIIMQYTFTHLLNIMCVCACVPEGTQKIRNSNNHTLYNYTLYLMCKYMYILDYVCVRTYTGGLRREQKW